MTYSEKLRDPRWQKKRLEIFQRDEWRCQGCGDSESTLHIHHRRYIQGREPWDYEDKLLLTLCEECHEEEKVYRPDIECDLIEVLKEKFLSDDILSILHGFYISEFVDSPGFMASAIGWTLVNNEAQKALVERYLEYLKANYSQVTR
jgi:hypothetical protein